MYVWGCRGIFENLGCGSMPCCYHISHRIISVNDVQTRWAIQSKYPSVVCFVPHEQTCIFWHAAVSLNRSVYYVQFSIIWALRVVVIVSWLTTCAVHTEVCSQYELGFLWDRASIQAQELCQVADSQKNEFPNDFSGLRGFQKCGSFCCGAGRGDSVGFGNFSELNKTVKLNRTVWNEWQRPTCNVFDGHSQLRRQILRTMQDCQKTKSTDLNRKLLLG